MGTPEGKKIGTTARFPAGVKSVTIYTYKHPQHLVGVFLWVQRLLKIKILAVPLAGG